MDKVLPVARSELILGGQKSGKSRRAEVLAQSWLAQSGSHRAVMIATGQAWDDEMTQRIVRHQADRAQRVPGMITVEEPLQLAQTIQTQSTPDTLIVVDCLTLWLTNWLMPVHGNAAVTEQTLSIETGQLLQSISSAPGPLVLVGNEIGLGVIPLGREVRVFVDALGLLNQQVAAACARVTLMAAGLPLTLKDVS
ncbi:MAG: bifunctional adenosylcobinamide kinase/adenosylcobinamide-phosphate guanylyltransferase [Polaromonas sp.]|uniref:bifunctional adenosylcobinamide kinase/adenosylcobinamide-phosphate guanylyltransferase n=1 Tax=Comamonadaceae TaxID=80864 RepID=UPI0027327AE3|nr:MULTISPECIES: bifunctional adenosylcobinamide kinase/adenosylcobinamide-phosphate guanylyltransferase [Comamonadaceae]MDP3246758.1 bifunctional adenosylcobinamide kinase/adenosylcobinamide-phosphate guanylyltransferase [Polaromonas sp.]MDP3335962.1 bifunctional adenosylcobinamide kinase/adenosylcobinamide-phosphate guanylyltransferase [Rhodoferax sp.]